MIEENKIKNNGIESFPISVSEINMPNRGSWRVLRPNININKCIRCKLCWIFCPDAAIKLGKKDYPKSDNFTCKGCGICANVCPVKCIRMERDMHRESRK